MSCCRAIGIPLPPRTSLTEAGSYPRPACFFSNFSFSCPPDYKDREDKASSVSSEKRKFYINNLRGEVSND